MAGKRQRTRRHYDANAHRQDAQGWYEDVGLEKLMELGRFGEAKRVAEFGCGTGRFAEWLLAGPLPEGACYTGFDISPGMLARAGARLAPYGKRVRLAQTDGAPRLPLPDGSTDRVVAAYVIDLLSEDDARALLTDAHRVLRPGGMICIASLTLKRRGLLTPAGSWLWRLVHGLTPSLVGGCRPVDLSGLLDRDKWEDTGGAVVSAWGVATEVRAAVRLQT